MSLFKPDGRLSLCEQYVRTGSRLADIGTDHGYLPLSLIRRGQIPSALACDINPLPLRSARLNIARCGLEDRITVRLSDGLDAVSSDEADDIVIAGMGGELIARILDDCAWVRDGAKRLILQPMTRHDTLIRWLCNNGFDIQDQDAVLDSGKYYTVLCVHYDGVKRECDVFTANVGKLLPDSEARIGFLTKCLNKMKKQVNGDPSLLPVIRQMEAFLA